MIACYHSNNNKEALSSFIEDIKPANFFTKYWILESPEEFLFLGYSTTQIARATCLTRHDVPLFPGSYQAVVGFCASAMFIHAFGELLLLVQKNTINGGVVISEMIFCCRNS